MESLIGSASLMNKTVRISIVAFAQDCGQRVNNGWRIEQLVEDRNTCRQVVRHCIYGKPRTLKLVACRPGISGFCEQLLRQRRVRLRINQQVTLIQECDEIGVGQHESGLVEYGFSLLKKGLHAFS